MTKHRSKFQKSKERQEKETVQDLKDQVRKLVKENQRLKSELKTLDAAFNKTAGYLRDQTKDIPLKKLIKGSESFSTLTEIKNDLMTCPKCNDKCKEIETLAGTLHLCPTCQYRKMDRKVKSDS